MLIMIVSDSHCLAMVLTGCKFKGTLVFLPILDLKTHITDFMEKN